jgi:hypothetical protein
VKLLSWLRFRVWGALMALPGRLGTYAAGKALMAGTEFQMRKCRDDNELGVTADLLVRGMRGDDTAFDELDERAERWRATESGK